MNESTVILQGWVGTKVEERVTKNGATCAYFRLGCTPRYHKDGTWVDGETSWFTINCWRSLGRNVQASIKQGDPVVVQGRIRTDVWQKDPDSPRSVSMQVDALLVGHDLNRGTTVFLKAQRQAPVDPVDDPEVKAFTHGLDEVTPELDAEGNVVQPAA